MATFKEALTTSLANFSKSIAKTYSKTADIVDNLLSTDSTLPLSAKQGSVLQTQIDTLNSNKVSGAFKQYRYTGSITKDVAVEIATIDAYDKVISISLICCATSEEVYDGGSVYINSSGKLMYVPKSTSTRTEIRVSVITKA